MNDGLLETMETGNIAPTHICSDDAHNYASLNKRFYMQVAMTATVTALCITMIAVRGQEGIYLPILSGLIGAWLPSPDPRVKRPTIAKST